ncbi:hypothetical protein [Microbispora sp. NPDC049633]|uniref:hypothetical protein n=1 Tax=Microbispora sp. NPDC049633 TaxID=3154355 RepID=UPI00343D30BD
MTAAKAGAEADPEVKDAKDAYNDAKAVRLLQESGYANAERLNFLVSRELTRRVGRSDRENRNTRWNT